MWCCGGACRSKVGHSIHSNCCFGHILSHPINHHLDLPCMYLPQYTVKYYHRSNHFPHTLVWRVSSSCQCWSSHSCLVCCLCEGHHQHVQQQRSRCVFYCQLVRELEKHHQHKFALDSHYKLWHCKMPIQIHVL